MATTARHGSSGGKSKRASSGQLTSEIVMASVRPARIKASRATDSASRRQGRRPCAMISTGIVSGIRA